MPISTKNSGTNTLEMGVSSFVSVASCSAGAHPLSVGVQQQSGRERPDDAREADPLCDERQRETDRQPDHQDDVGLAHSRRQPHDRAGEIVAEPDRESEEHNGFEDDSREGDPGQP